MALNNTLVCVADIKTKMLLSIVEHCCNYDNMEKDY